MDGDARRAGTSIVAEQPGVVVVGAGATGLVTAIELRRRGVPVLVLERSTVCAMQSGQCHGWLHRGAVFPEASTSEVAELVDGARWWEQAAGAAGLIDGEISGSDPGTAERVQALWDRLEVPYEISDLPDPPLGWSARGGEPSVVPLSVLRDAAEAAGVQVHSGEVTAIEPAPGDAGLAQALTVSSGSTRLRLHAPVVVLAAGASITRLVPGAAAQLSERLSFMLVARSDFAPRRAVTIPEQASFGLMVVPREREGRRYLLVSNFVSYAASAGLQPARQAWLHGVGATVRTILPHVWADPDALWGTYAAVKVEPERHLGLGVPGARLLDTPFRNVLAGVPGKLVLAPVLAGRLAARCEALLAEVSPPARPLSPPVGRLDAHLVEVPWGPEAWELTPLVGRATVFGRGDAA